MMVLVTYDVNTETVAGRKRLRQVVKLCVDFVNVCNILSSNVQSSSRIC